MKLVEKKWWWSLVSLGIVSLGILMGVGRMANGKSAMNMGIDFVGGTSMILKLDTLDALQREGTISKQTMDQKTTQVISNVRKILQSVGFSHTQIQLTDDLELVIKTSQHSSVQNHQIRDALAKELGPIEVIEVDYIGPSIGHELRNTSLLLVILVSAGLMGYITLRFEFAYGVGALASTLHDAILTLALASIFYIEIDTAFVAALLTILGYSINDTIVIFDRIRENLSKVNTRLINLNTVVNQSIIETFGRTINTVVTVLIVLLALLLFGGNTIQSFCLTLLLGTLVGTYSSICVASPAMVMAYRRPIKSEVS